MRRPSALVSSGIFEPTHGGTIADLLRTGMKWAAIGLVLPMFRGDYSRAVRRLALAFTAVVMLSPIIQPWYILWFLPFVAVTGIRNDWQIRCLYVGVTFFVVFGAQDQLSVWSFVELAIDASSLAFVTALLFTFYLLVLDIHTRKLLIEGKPLDWARRGWRWLLDQRRTAR